MEQMYSLDLPMCDRFDDKFYLKFIYKRLLQKIT